MALICGVAPLWASQAIPLVDLPQHLHLISVLHRLDDASTLFPEIFARRPELTPYLGYYYVVSGLNWLLPLELANRVFLSAVVAGLPLSLAFLLRSLDRPAWPALLALPFAWGDSLAWGFINYCASLPLALVTCGLFVRTISSPAPERKKWAIWLAVLLVLVLLFHVQAFAWLGVALPFLLLTTPAPEGKAWRARIPALAGVAPGVLLFVLWVGLRVGQPAEIAPGQPWRSWGPMLSKENLGWKSLDQNLSEFVNVPKNPAGGLELGETRFPILAGMLHDGSDQRAVRLVFVLALAVIALRLWTWREKKEPDGYEGPGGGKFTRWRIVGLAAIAFVLFLALPFDIRGYMYYLNTRYVHLAAALLVSAVPVVPASWTKRLVYVAAATSFVLMAPLWSAFKVFDSESRALTELAKFAGDKPRVMGLIYSTGSAAVTHPVYLHASTVIARERGGLTNFSFALTPHSPLMYRGTPPPTFPSEWRPDQMRWEEHGRYYDHFVIRGPRPEQLFGGRLETELYVAGQAGDFFLVRKR
ncbi:MAG: hypothetical protein U0228_32605 [Myxococcaceae bacterium]